MFRLELRPNDTLDRTERGGERAVHALSQSPEQLFGHGRVIHAEHAVDMLDDADQPVLRRDDTGLQSPEAMREFILGKFDWLALADPATLLSRWDKFFSEIHPSVLAPIRGRVQVGRPLVSATIDAYRQAAFFHNEQRS